MIKCTQSRCDPDVCYCLSSNISLTNVIPGWKIFILVTGVALLPVQQKVVDHLLLVFTETQRERGTGNDTKGQEVRH